MLRDIDPSSISSEVVLRYSSHSAKLSEISTSSELGLIVKHHRDNKGNDKGQKVMQPTQLCITF